MAPRYRLLVTVLLVLFMLACVTTPVTAEYGFIAPAVPGIATVVIDGVEVVLASTAIIAIGAELSKHWDALTSNLENFASEVGKAIDGLISAKKWVEATSNEGKALIQAEKELFEAAAATGGKKPGEDKWYHEAKRKGDTVEINTERLTEEKAVAKVKNGKDIFTLKEDLAKGVAKRATREVAETKGLPDIKIEDLLEKIKYPETHCGGKLGYYPHYHPLKEITGNHPHIWYCRP